MKSGSKKIRIGLTVKDSLSHGGNISKVQEIGFIGLETLEDIALMEMLSVLVVLIIRLKFGALELNSVKSTRIYPSTR